MGDFFDELRKGFNTGDTKPSSCQTYEERNPFKPGGEKKTADDRAAEVLAREKKLSEWNASTPFPRRLGQVAKEIIRAVTDTGPTKFCGGATIASDHSRTKEDKSS